jgi:hypothetical protein
MANRLYNKQVTPKGYKKGGSVRDTRKTEQMIGASISSKREKGSKVKKDYKLGTKFQGDYKGKSVPGKVKEFFKTGVKQTVGTAKKIGEKLRVKKMGGGMMKRPMMEKGGSLKPVQPNQKGLSKLPTEVRNKMGYMKKGGKVNGK